MHPHRILPSDLPAQFQLLVGGTFITSLGMTMSFPFLTLYLGTQLGVPMDRIGLLFVGNSIGGLAAQVVAGPMADRFGRKPVMLAGLLTESIVALGFSQATDFDHFVLLATLSGFFGSIFMPASSAMVVDLVGPERRARAFAILRMAANLGWVIGPSLGGILAGRSYTMLFVGAAVAQVIYMAALLLFARETLPRGEATATRPGWSAGYESMLRDRSFLVFLAASILTTAAVSQLTTTMPVYLKLHAGVPESGYGLLMALNAGMVVVFQFPITRLVERLNRANVLSIGALLYAIGYGSLGWWQGLPLFAASVAILTLGELAMVPVASALVADLAPIQMRATYMAAFSLTWTIGFGIGPTLGGVILARWDPTWLWHAAFAALCVAALAFLPLRRIGQSR